MKIYRHRVNTVAELTKINPTHGVEVDLRTHFGDLVLSHDPYEQGELFSDWLRYWRGQSIILNVKEDGLEEKILAFMEKNRISEYFFLDQSYPSIRRCIAMGNNKVATRVSDYEALETSIKSDSEWVWLDSFSGSWDYLPEAVSAIAKNGQKTCLVSPELQRIDSADELKGLQGIIQDNNLMITAVCTKFAEGWEK